MNRSTEIWGDDAFEFKYESLASLDPVDINNPNLRPERWGSLPDKVTSIPGIWAHTLSFLGGPRSCIGFQFSIIE